MRHSSTHILLALISLIISACTGLPEGVEPVKEFDINRYMGKWYEIARLDHSFERHLNQVSAEYSLRDNGGVRVINRGFSTKTGSWKEAEGKAYFVREPDEAYLKVSFFGPFYGSYVVFELDKAHYQYAFVASHNKSYLWLLSRTPTVKKEIIDLFVQKSHGLGFDTNSLIWVNHKPVNSTQH